MNKIKWLYPGMHVKRWIFLSVLGVVMVALGFAIVVGLDTISAIEGSLIRYAYELTDRKSVV